MSQENIVSTKELQLETAFLEAKKQFLIDNLDKAEELFLDLYDQESTNAVIAFELSKLYKKKEDHTNAMKYGQLAYSRAPENLDIADNYGEMLIKDARYVGAIDLYKQLSTAYPEDQEVADKLGTAYVFNQNYDEGIAVYEALEKKIGVKEGIIRRKIEAYELSGQKEKIEGELIKLTRHFPEDVQYMRNLAIYYKEMEMEEQARVAFEKVLELDPNDAAANMALAGNPAAPANDNNYIRSLIPIIENQSIPIDQKVMELIPYLEELSLKPDAERSDALLSAVEVLKNTHPDEAKAYAIYGDVLFISKRDAEAIKAYEKSIALEDSVYPVWENLMLAYKNEGRQEDLLQKSEEAIDYFPNQFSAYMLHAEALLHTGEHKKAMYFLEDALLIASGKPTVQSDIYTRMAQQNLKEEAWEKAHEQLEKAIELNENNGLAKGLMEDNQESFFMRGIK